MSKRRRTIDPIAEYIERANRPTYKGVGVPPPWLGIKPAQHPNHVRRDALALFAIGLLFLPFTLVTIWAQLFLPMGSVFIIVPLAFSFIVLTAFGKSISAWRKLRRK
jgi:hypothetical protein